MIAFGVDWIILAFVTVLTIRFTPSWTRVTAENISDFSPDTRTLELGDSTYVVDFNSLWVWAIPILYYVAMMIVLAGLTGWTIGKVLAGVRLVRGDGRVPGVGRALVRSLVFWIGDLGGLIGLPVAVFSKGHRRLGDMAAGTFVVDRHFARIPLKLTRSGVVLDDGQSGRSGRSGRVEDAPVIDRPSADVATTTADPDPVAAPCQDLKPASPEPLPAETAAMSAKTEPAAPDRDDALVEPHAALTGAVPSALERLDTTEPGAEVPTGIDTPGSQTTPASEPAPATSPEPSPTVEVPSSAGTPSTGPIATGGDLAISGDMAASETRPAQNPQVETSGTSAKAVSDSEDPTTPRWDPARRAYIVWDPSRAEWLEYDDARQEWILISRA